VAPRSSAVSGSGAAVRGTIKAQTIVRRSHRVLVLGPRAALQVSSLDRGFTGGLASGQWESRPAIAGPTLYHANGG
jgi:predicted membrane-bound mannosyltransferase